MKAHAFERVEVGLLNGVVLVSQFTIHRVAKAEDGRAGQLRLGIHRVEDGAAIRGDPHLVDADAACRHRYVNHFGHGHTMGVGEGEAQPAPRPDVGACPVRHLAHRIQHAAAVGVGDQAQAFLQRVGTSGVDQFGQEAFVEETVLTGPWRSPGPYRHHRRCGVARDAVIGDCTGLVEGTPDQHRVRPGRHDEDATEPGRDQRRADAVEIIGQHTAISDRATANGHVERPGIVSLAMLLTHGAAWLALKSEGEIAGRARAIGVVTGILTMVAYAAAGAWLTFGIDGYALAGAAVTDGPSNPLYSDVIRTDGWLGVYAQRPWIAIAPLLAFLGLAMTVRALRSGGEVSPLL